MLGLEVRGQRQRSTIEEAVMMEAACRRDARPVSRYNASKIFVAKYRDATAIGLVETHRLQVAHVIAWTLEYVVREA